jgi:putative Holliday junction resolvase
MALDVGARRIGLAVSDPLGLTAQALPTFVRGADLAGDLNKLQIIIEEMDVKLLVVGLPYNMNGSLGEQAVKIQEFADKLRQFTGLELRYIDERLTTAAADSLMKMDGQNRKKRSQKADMIAAQLILQSFLR